MTNTITTAAFLLLSLLISASLAAAQTPVLDSDGNSLRSGTRYYIVPAVDNRRGGVTPNAINSSAPCPLDVLQASQNTSRGSSVTFTPVDPRQGVIEEATDLNIRFSTVPARCPTTSTVWQLTTVEESTTGNLYVRTGGVAGNPGAATVNNWFKIEKDQENYKIVFCPSVCSTCKVTCDFIGVYVDGRGRWRLAQGFLLDNPFQVKFLKA